MLILKSGTIIAQTISGAEELPGLLSEHFGLHHRYPEYGPNDGWIVYHLCSGLTLGTIGSLWLARGLVITMESSGFDWQFDYHNSSPPENLEGIKAVYLSFYHRQLEKLRKVR